MVGIELKKKKKPLVISIFSFSHDVFKKYTQLGSLNHGTVYWEYPPVFRYEVFSHFFIPVCIIVLTPSQTSPGFYVSAVTSLLKTLRESDPPYD